MPRSSKVFPSVTFTGQSLASGGAKDPDITRASRKFLWYLHRQGAQFSVSYPVPVGKVHMINWINKKHWQPALDRDGNEHADPWIINATRIIPPEKHPQGTKIFLRAEPLYAGATPTPLDVDGHPGAAFLANYPRWLGPSWTPSTGPALGASTGAKR